MRTSLIVFHRWLAILVSVVLIVIALSGAATVFEQQIGSANALRVPPGSQALPIGVLASRAIAAVGGGHVTAVGFARAPDQAVGISVDSGKDSHDLMVNQYTGAVIGPPPPESRLIRIARKVHQLHTQLLAGGTGKVVVAFVTLAALVLTLTGVVIWWRDRAWRIRWSASWKRIVFDLHHALGVVSAAVLLVITGTGVWMGYSRQIDPLVLRLNHTPAQSGQPKLPPHDSGAVAVSIDSLVALAQGVVPGAPLLLILIPDDAPAMAALRYPEDHTPGGRSRVYIDQYHGVVLRALNTRTAEAGTRLMNLQRALHTGDIFGGLSQVIWFLASVILASQAVTGVLMWWNGRAGRRALATASSP